MILSQRDVEVLIRGNSLGTMGRKSPSADELVRVVTSHAECGRIWDAYMDEGSKEFFVLDRGEVGDGDD